MTIHIFNPEHDMALGSNLERFTAPHAGRQLRHDLGFLPALWAKAGEYVLVGNIDTAVEGLRRTGFSTGASFIDWDSMKARLGRINQPLNVQPWGWDRTLRCSLKGIGLDDKWLPTNAQLNVVRLMSHRSWAAENVLQPLRDMSFTVGESYQLKSNSDARKFLAERKSIVLKAPWSSSGRGIRYLSNVHCCNIATNYEITPQIEGWISNVIARQGCVVAEPYYNKVCDFGMEFQSDGKGNIAYKGLSLFDTVNGAYTGNILDDESHKDALLCRYVPQRTLHVLRERIVEILLGTFMEKYVGMFGIDMMIVRDTEGKLAVHPCVELNLRMTMGHVAILLAKRFGLEDKVMRINFSGGSYRLRVESL